MRFITIRKSIKTDFEQCKNLLSSNDLPTEFSLHTFQNFLIAESSNQEIVGLVGLEFEKNVGLIRSLVVVPHSRLKGIGTKLVKEIETFARSENVIELFLLTNTSKKFFQTKGYSVYPREKVPDFIRMTQEFSSICPESSICMRKNIGDEMPKEIKFVCCGAEPNTLTNLENDKFSDDVAINILKKIAHPMRLKILRILTIESEICSCELTQLFLESQPIISRQLSILANAGIIVSRTLTMQGIAGRWHAYSIHPEMKSLISYIIQPFSRVGINGFQCDCE